MPKEGAPQKRGNCYRIRWTAWDGSRHSATFTHKAAATARLREVQAEARKIRSGLLPTPCEAMRVDELCDRWLLHAVHKRSLKDDECIMRVHIRPQLGGLSLAEVDTAVVAGFKVDVSDGLTPARVNRILGLFRAMLNWAMSREWISKMPLFKLNSERKACTDYAYLKTAEEVRRFLTAALQHDAELQHFFRKDQPELPALTHDLYATAVYTGLRAGELGALTVDDVHFDKGLINVNKSWHGPTKSGEPRWVTIQDGMRPMLRTICERSVNGFLFPSKAGTMLQPGARIFRETLHLVLEIGGFKPRVMPGKTAKPYITFHDLRHTYASHWMMSSGDLFTLQRLLGHGSIRTTERYAHLSQQGLRAEARRLVF